ncbi:24118_t:CDS:1, partial [Dentiscutata erythropus]
HLDSLSSLPTYPIFKKSSFILPSIHYTENLKDASILPFITTFQLINSVPPLISFLLSFDDIERTSGFIKSYHPDDTGIIVINKNFSDNSYDQALKMKVFISF